MTVTGNAAAERGGQQTLHTSLSVANGRTVGKVLALYPQNALEGVHVQVGLGQQPLELGILRFELAQVLSSRDLHAAELGVPLVKRGMAEAAIAHSSLIGMPASACLRKPMICSSVNLLFFMSVILRVVDGLH